MKPRRDITLGEMQDECKKHRHGECNNCTKCDPVIKKICDDLDLMSPYGLDLSDPPRFNEAQMALLKAFQGVGAERVRVTTYGHGIRTFDLIDRFGNAMAFTAILGSSADETLDIADLLGKDGESK